MRNFSRTLGDVCFPDSLECIDSLSIFFAHLHDFTKATFADNFEKVESFDCQGLISGWFEVDF